MFNDENDTCEVLICPFEAAVLHVLRQHIRFDEHNMTELTFSALPVKSNAVHPCLLMPENATQRSVPWESTHFYLSYRTDILQTVLRIYGGGHELLRPIRAQFVLRHHVFRQGRMARILISHVEHGIYEDIYPVSVRGGDGLYKLFFRAPSSRNGSFLVELAQVPLYRVR